MKIHRQDGYTLIELVISVTVVSILTLTIGVFFVNATIAWTRNNTETQLQEENQRAIDSIKKDISSANALALINDNEITLYVPALNSAGSPLYSDANKAFTCKNTVQYQFDSGNLYRYVTANTSSGCNAAAGNATSDSTTTIIKDDSTSDILSGDKFDATTGTTSCAADIYTCNNISVSFTRQKSQFGRTYTLTSRTTASLAHVDPTYLEYYFYAVTPADCNAAWSNDANAYDGSDITFATSIAIPGPGGPTSYCLVAHDTSAPTTGGTILEVAASAIGCRVSGNGPLRAEIHEDGLASVGLLGTPSVTTGTCPVDSGWATLSTHSGGWTWAKIATLDARAYGELTGSSHQLYSVKLRVRVI